MDDFRTYNIVALTTVAVAMSVKSKPYLSFRADLVSKNDVKNRTVVVFNTEKAPNLVAEVEALLNAGPAIFTVNMDKVGKGDVARIVAIAPVAKGKPANDDQPMLALETPAAMPVFAETVIEMPPKRVRKSRAKIAQPASDENLDIAV